MESTYLLHAATGDPRLLGVGASLHARLRDKNRAACGYASVGDIGTGQLEVSCRRLGALQDCAQSWRCNLLPQARRPPRH